MTNAEKYLKDNVSVEEITDEFEMWHYFNSDVKGYGEALYRFLQEKENVKLALTEDERVILRNINTNNYDRVGKKTSGALYLGIAKEKGIDSTFEDFFQDSELFQFIKERRRIFNRRIIERRVEMEKKIYSKWAFTENEEEKMKINKEIYNELKEKYKIYEVSDIDHKEPTKEELEQNDIVYSRRACYGHGEYRVYKCPENLSADELALICDGGNLCFGYNGNKSYLTISED